MGDVVMLLPAPSDGGANWPRLPGLFAASAALKFSNNRFRSGHLRAWGLNRSPMDNAVVARANANALPLVEPAGFGARVGALPLKTKLSFLMGLAALVAVVLAMTLWNSQGDYKVLYANPSDKKPAPLIAPL